MLTMYLICFFFGKDPTQRRNTQYLVLFKNPIDQMPIQVLARQMYPTNAGRFIDYFNKVTAHPYSHMVVDLKPHTPESCRMKANIFQKNEGSRSHEPTTHICPQVHDNDNIDITEPVRDIDITEPVNQNHMSCFDCGVM